MPRQKVVLTPVAQATVDKHGEELCRDLYEEFGENSLQAIADARKFTRAKTEAIIEAGRQLENRDEANRPETNVALLTRLMEHSQHSVIVQMFVMDSVGRMAEAVANTPREELHKKFAESGFANFMNPDLWQTVAKEIDAELKERHK